METGSNFCIAMVPRDTAASLRCSNAIEAGDDCVSGESQAGVSRDVCQFLVFACQIFGQLDLPYLPLKASDDCKDITSRVATNHARLFGRFRLQQRITRAAPTGGILDKNAALDEVDDVA